MEINPPARVTRFAKLEPGDLFIILDYSATYYAIKTQPVDGDDFFVSLGPTFGESVEEPFLLAGRSATVVSFGKNYSVLLPLEASAWTEKVPERRSVCLALSSDGTYIRANRGPSPLQANMCYLDVKSGKLTQGLGSGGVAYTTTWEIAALGANHPPRSILKYPLG